MWEGNGAAPIGEQVAPAMGSCFSTPSRPPFCAQCSTEATSLYCSCWNRMMQTRNITPGARPSASGIFFSPPFVPAQL